MFFSTRTLPLTMEVPEPDDTRTEGNAHDDIEDNYTFDPLVASPRPPSPLRRPVARQQTAETERRARGRGRPRVLERRDDSAIEVQ